MKKDSGPYKKIKIYCYIVGLTAFLVAFFVGIFLLHNLEKNEKTTGKYMAQVTEKRVRARLDQYIMLSELLLQTFIRNRKMRELLDWICCRSMSEKRMQLWQRRAENIRLGDHTS